MNQKLFVSVLLPPMIACQSASRAMRKYYTPSQHESTLSPWARQIKLTFIVILRSKLPPRLHKFATRGALIKLVLSPFAFLTIALTLIVRPLIVIKFFKVNPWRIGHLLIEIEIARLHALNRSFSSRRKHFVVYYFPEREPANRYLQDKWKGLLPSVEGHWGWLLFRLAKRTSENLFITPSLVRDKDGLLSKFPCSLRFSETESETGENFLNSVGCQSRKFVCLMVRDSAYLDTIRTDKSFSDYEYRDSKIMTYLPAAEMLTRHGYTVFRMGQIVNDNLSSSNPKIIDYAKNGMRTEFLDLYLGANCSFFVSTGTGIDTVAQVFRRPMLYVNMVGFYEDILLHNYLIYPKIYKDASSLRRLSFREIAKRGLASEVSRSRFEQQQTVVEDLSEQEILDAVAEMLSRINGDYVPSVNDKDRGAKVLDIFRTETSLQGEFNRGYLRGEFASCFLSRYSQFLD
jgi:putative glycosyltransferase (TIGR04372 family)